MKYTQGDKVQILYPAEGAEKQTEDWVGETGTIVLVGDNFQIQDYYVKGPDGRCWWFGPDDLRPAEEEDLPE